MKKLFFALLMLISVASSAQLLQTKAEIIKEHGYDYTYGVMDDGSPYIEYGIGYNSQRMYFTIMDSGEQLCYMYQIIGSISELSEVKDHLEQNYTSIGNMQYQNLETGLTASIYVESEFFIVTMYYETVD